MSLIISVGKPSEYSFTDRIVVGNCGYQWKIADRPLVYVTPSLIGMLMVFCSVLPPPPHTSLHYLMTSAVLSFSALYSAACLPLLRHLSAVPLTSWWFTDCKVRLLEVYSSTIWLKPLSYRYLILFVFCDLFFWLNNVTC